MKTQADFPVGSRVAMRCAGMTEPKFGKVTGHPDIETGLFVRYDGEPRGKFEHLLFIKLIEGETNADI